MPRRPRKLRAEEGVTRTSLENAKLLAEERGNPVSVELHRDFNPSGRATHIDGYRVVARYPDGSSHTYTGFGWGYGGEGPNGLASFLAGSGIPLSREEIFALDGDVRGLVWSWPGRE